MSYYISPEHPLYDAAHKVVRAHHHLKAFTEEIKAFYASDPMTIGKEIDSKRSQYVYRIEVRANWSRDLPVIVGDVVHNLRASLDYLVCQLVRLRVPDTDCGFTQFPILKNPADWNNRRTNQMVEGISKDALDKIKASQPYHYGKAYREHALWRLHSLSNTDKHRALNPNPTDLLFKFKGSWGVDWFNGPNVFGAVVTVPARDDPEHTFEPSISFEMTFGDIDGNGNGVTGADIWDIYKVIHDDLFPQFFEYFPESVDKPETGTSENAI